MEYVVTVPNGACTRELHESILQEDPSACIDTDPSGGGLRIATVLSATELVGIFRASGFLVATDDVETKPSVCCGGCSG